LRLFSFGGYGLALVALALVVFGAIEWPSFGGSFQFSIVTIQRISPPGNLEFDYLGIFQSLNLRISIFKKSFGFL